MAKTLENLTNEELDIIQEYVDLFGISEEEALAQALSEGSIVEQTGGSISFAPEGFKELKYYVVNNKSHLYKINKELKKAKKAELFPEDNFLLDIKIDKKEDGSYNLDNCGCTVVGDTAEIIVNRVMYKAARAAFDASGKPEETNFETTLVPSIYSDDQENMISYGKVVKGKSAKAIIDELKKEYHDGKNGKTQEKVPEKLKVKFKVVLFGLIKVEDTWEKFYLELSNRYDDKDKDPISLVGFFNQQVTGIKTKWVCELKVTGEDNFQNPIIQVIPPEAPMSTDEFKKLSALVRETTEAVDSFVEGQKASISAKNTKASAEKQEDDSSDNGTDEDPFKED